MNIFRAFKKSYFEQRFEPGFVGLCTNPFYIARTGLFRAIQKHAAHVQGRVLDVGCGTQPYRKLYGSTEYIGLEIDSPATRRAGHADFFYDGATFPFESDSFDSVVCNQVLEHVFNPREFLLEIHRVLRDNGHFALSVPFCWDEHEQPNDYARYSSFGIRHLLETSGFSIVDHRKTAQDASTLFQLLICYLYKKVNPSNIYLNVVYSIAVYFPITLAGVVFGSLLPSNPDLYLDNVLLVRKTD